MIGRRAAVAALAAMGLQGRASTARANDVPAVPTAAAPIPAPRTGATAPSTPTAPATDTDRRGHDAALRMRRLAESWGDEPYGAVIVLGGRIVGEGPSRVVRDADPDAHAERVAIRDAQARLGTSTLAAGAVLYSTSRPCAACEAAAARAGVERMVHGASLVDAGRPVDRAR